MIKLYRLLPWLLPKVAPGARDQLIKESRWLVIDCESSGLDPRRDSLLEVACVAVEGTQISLADSFEGVLRQEESSSIANILIHGISGHIQLNGAAPDAIMQELASRMTGRLIVGYHAAFDRELCRRALRRFALRRLHGSWLDLADLAPALRPDLAPTCTSLDDWLAALNIPVTARHRAAGDAFATAQLLAKLVTPLADTQRADDLYRLAKAHRELSLLQSQVR